MGPSLRTNVKWTRRPWTRLRRRSKVHKAHLCFWWGPATPPDQGHEQKARVLHWGHPDLLWFLKDIWPIPDGVILATIAVSALYSNIQREDGLEAVRKAIETREDKSVPAHLILELLDLVLKYTHINSILLELYQEVLMPPYCRQQTLPWSMIV